MNGHADMRNYRLEKANSGQSLSVLPGDTISIELPGNPATGFDWAFEWQENSIFDLVKKEYRTPENNNIGAGGMHFFLFKINKSGQGTIKLKYWQEWEGDTSIRDSFSISVYSTA
jgi:predicted secreted protein